MPCFGTVLKPGQPSSDSCCEEAYLPTLCTDCGALHVSPCRHTTSSGAEKSSLEAFGQIRKIPYANSLQERLCPLDLFLLYMFYA